MYWKLLKETIKTKSFSEVIPPLVSVDESGNEEFHITDYEKANCLNTYFSSISTINDEGKSLPPMTQLSNVSLSNLVVTEDEVKDIIKTLVTNKAVGEDSISHKVLKCTCNSIARPLCMLFNKSLTECIFPDLWKSAIVMPLFKKGDAHKPSNYRPISLLSCVGKLMERIIYKHLYNHLVSEKLIYSKQSGFLSGHSTVYQLLDIYDQISSSLDKKTYTCIVFCDISKAFDRVWRLHFKLKQNGIVGNVLL